MSWPAFCKGLKCISAKRLLNTEAPKELVFWFFLKSAWGYLFFSTNGFWGFSCPLWLTFCTDNTHKTRICCLHFIEKKINVSLQGYRPLSDHQIWFLGLVSLTPPSFSYFTALLPQTLTWLCLELLDWNISDPSSPKELPIHCNPCCGAGWRQLCLVLHSAVCSFPLWWWTRCGSLIKRDEGMLQPRLFTVLCTDYVTQLPWCLHARKSLPSLWGWGYQVLRCFFFLLVSLSQEGWV